MKLINQQASYLGDITYTGEDSTLNQIEMCGRLCYRSDISKDINSRNRILNTWKSYGHTSLYEHSQIVLYIEDLKNMKNRILRYLMQSGLYRFADLDYYHSDHIIAGNLRFWLELYDKINTNEVFNQILGGIKAALPNFLNHWEFEARPDLIMDKSMVPWKLHRYAAFILLDRGVLAEWTRHDMGFSVESSRYCNYSKDKYGKEIQIHDQDNVGFHVKDTDDIVRAEECARMIWKDACFQSERAYLQLLKHVKPEIARQVLNMSLITRMHVSTIPWYWDNFFKLRDDKAAHPNIRKLAKELKEQMFSSDYLEMR